MTNLDLAYLMKEMPVFDGLKNREIALLSMVVKDESFDAGDPIFTEGDSGACCYFLVSGEVDVIKHINGKPRLLSTVGAHQVFGHISLMDNGPRQASYVARTAARALRLDRSDFEALFNSGSRFAFKFQGLIGRAAARQLREANTMLTSLVDQARTTSSGLDPNVRLQDVQSILGRNDFAVGGRRGDKR